MTEIIKVELGDRVTIPQWGELFDRRRYTTTDKSLSSETIFVVVGIQPHEEFNVPDNFTTVFVEKERPKNKEEGTELVYRISNTLLKLVK